MILRMMKSSVIPIVVYAECRVLYCYAECRDANR
jgi:hypothetical protein